MSLAALAGYASDSDDSSESDAEIAQTAGAGPAVPLMKHPDRASTSEKRASENVRNSQIFGVDSIEDEDEFVLSEYAPEFPEALFANLPVPKPTEAVEEDVSDIISLKPTKSKKRQIVLPKLSDFKDDDDYNVEEKPKPKLLRTAAGSGLIALLPKPAAFKMPVDSKTSLARLMPQSLGKRPASSKSETADPKKKVHQTSSNDDNDDAHGAGSSSNSFFSFEEPKLSDDQIKDLLKKEDLVPRNKRGVSPEIIGPSKISVSEQEHEPYETMLQPSVPAAYPEPGLVSLASNDLPPEALLQLRGRREEKIEMFTIDAADFTVEARSNLVKNITIEDKTPPPTENEPTRRHKSKHHITHLAFMAKARENELKNQWSVNKMTKRETQQKYGF